MSHYADGLAVIQTERTIGYSAKDIYLAFSEPASLSQWWGPNGFTNTFEVFDFSVGGEWRFEMHGPDGHTYKNESKFLTLRPFEEIEIEHISAPRFVLTVILDSVEGGTRVTWRQTFESAEVAEAVRHVCVPGNEQNLDRLTDLLNVQRAQV